MKKPPRRAAGWLLVGVAAARLVPGRGKQEMTCASSYPFGLDPLCLREEPDRYVCIVCDGERFFGTVRCDICDGVGSWKKTQRADVVSLFPTRER
jgi:hypothetical protein